MYSPDYRARTACSKTSTVPSLSTHGKAHNLPLSQAHAPQHSPNHPCGAAASPTQPDVFHRNKSKPKLGNTLQNPALIHTSAADLLQHALVTSHLVKSTHRFCAAESSLYVLSTQSNINASSSLPCSPASGKLFST